MASFDFVPIIMWGVRAAARLIPVPSQCFPRTEEDTLPRHRDEAIAGVPEWKRNLGTVVVSKLGGDQR